MIKSISHIALVVEDMDRSLAFYCDGLGLKHAFDLTMADLAKVDDNPRLAAAAERGLPLIKYLQIAPGQFLELFYNHQQLKKPYKSVEASGFQHLSLEVDDIEAMKERLNEKGYSPTSDIKVSADCTRQMWYADPDGNEIEIMEYTPESWQVTKAVF
jgi:catechol 2,3-dioxygenase-like lactoylglutathione lyase family enzyme